MDIAFDSKGDFKRTEDFLKKLSRRDIYRSLEAYAQAGVDALAAATPRDSGQTASMWGYEILEKRGSYSIFWYNSNTTRDGVPVAILLQVGHGTGTGGYVVGKDYINPAMRPIFDKIEENVWKAVISA